MKNILLYGFFGFNNLGDDLLLLEALHKIPQYFNLYIKAPKECKNNLNEYKEYRDFTIITNNKELLRRKYEYLIFCGGGLFPKIKYGIRDFLRFLLLKICCKKVVINGCGIVPKPKSLLFGLFLKQLYYCSVRDNVSAEFVSKFRNEVINCGDLYWGNEKHYTKKSTNKKCIVCLANPFSDNELENSHFIKRYKLFLNNLSEMLTVIKNKGFQVEYLPFHGESDKKLISDLQTKIGSCDKVLQRGADFNLETIDKLFSNYQLGFCMRFHSILLSIKNTLPMIAINYDYKSESLLQEAKLNRYGIRFGIRNDQFFGQEIDLDMNSLYKAFDDVLTNSDEYRKKASEFYKIKHKQVLENYKKIFNN